MILTNYDSKITKYNEGSDRMGIQRTWWILFCFYTNTQIYAIVALQYPMRYHPPQRRTIGIGIQHQERALLKSTLTILRRFPRITVDTTTVSQYSLHSKSIQSTLCATSNQRSYISSSSLKMTTLDDGRMPNANGPIQSPPTTDNAIDDDTAIMMQQEEWEKLYQGKDGSNSKDKSDGIIDSLRSENDAKTPAYEIRVVSFDLDNTLWNTTATIDAANDVLAQHLQEQLLRTYNISIRSNVRVEKVMGALFNANKTRYSPVEAEKAKSPVLLTQLRKDAIHNVVTESIQNQTMNHRDTDQVTIVQSMVENAFDVWTQARHDAISQQLVPSTTYVMECIQSLPTALRTTSGNPNTKRMLIGAITDGNSNPKLVPALSNVFDFYINAEMVGVGKPNKRIYLQAAREVFQKFPIVFDDMTTPITMMMMTEEELSDDQIEDLIGPWWIHIGDDFMKDIVASNSLKMRNIWTRELCKPKQDVNASPSQQQEKSSQRTVDELMQVVNEKKIVEMSIGADTYLADTMSYEFATAIVEELRDVVHILQKWQNDALVASTTSSMQRQPVNDKIEDSTMSTAPSPTDRSIRRENVSSEAKFCIECGTKLPAVAKFCSSCGAAQ